MRLFISLILLTLLTPQCLLAEEAGKIAAIEGNAFYHPGSQPRGEPITGTGKQVEVGDMIRTKHQASAGVILIDGSKVAIDEQSSAIFRLQNAIDVDSGIVVVDIKKRGGLSGFQIKTKTAVIGVKGTQFVVAADDKNLSVYTREGTVSVESIKGEFKQYKRKVMDEFAAFKKQMQDGFEQFKAEQQREFVGFVKSIDVKAGKMISISGEDLEEADVSKELENKFDLLNF